MDKKRAYREKKEAQIEHMSAQIERLKARTKAGVADAKLDVAVRVEALANQRDKAQHKLNKMIDAGDDVWEDFKDEVEETFDEMKDGLERFRARFKGDDQEHKPTA